MTWKTTWADVIALLENNPRTKSKVCQIALSEDDELLYNVFHHVLQTKEYSERAMSLCDRVLTKNSGDYSAWWLRRRCLESGMESISIEDDLEFTKDWLKETPKNYQAWYHRQWLVEFDNNRLLKNTEKRMAELNSVTEALEDDAKNVNAWQYREVLVGFCLEDLESSEWDYSGQMIILDPRNNSAWNYRHWLLENRSQPVTMELLGGELTLALQWIQRTPANESTYSYLVDIMDQYKECMKRDTSGRATSDTVDYMDEIKSTLIDLQKTKRVSIGAVNLCYQLFPLLATELCEDLMKSEPIRTPYLEYLKQKLESLKTTTPASIQTS